MTVYRDVSAHVRRVRDTTRRSAAPPASRDIVKRALSPELYDFLYENLDTFEKLELVLVLRSAEKPLSVAEIALQLQVGPEALRRVVVEVAATGIVGWVDDESVRLSSGDWGPLIEEAAALYASEPSVLVKCFTRIGLQRMRGMAARAFADAFRIRKKGD